MLTTSAADKSADERARGQLADALACVAERDQSALRQVFELTSAKLFGICLRICGGRDGAEEVMQDVLLKIWNHAATFDASRSSPITWLCAIARNAAIDWQRVNARSKEFPFHLAPEITAELAGTERMLMDREEYDRLHHCIDQLDERQRHCIRAAFFDGLTYADLAMHVGAPLNTVKTWVRRGMQHLKVCVSDD